MSLQEMYAPKSICFGCGPVNEKGLRIKSIPVENSEQNEVVAEFMPEPHHQAFPNVINGGIIGSLLDCHCNWAGAYAIMKATGASEPPCTVTAEYKITLNRPTPFGVKLHLKAHATKVEGDRVWVSGELMANGKVCARCEGLFVAVKEGHPAYHRW